MKKLIDLLFFTKGNKKVYGTYFKYVMFRKFGSVVVSTLGVYLVLLKYKLDMLSLVEYTGLSFILFTIIVYHALPLAIMKRQYFTHIIIVIITVLGWSANGFYFIQSKIDNTSKNHIAYNAKKYEDLKYKINKDKDNFLSTTKDKLSDLESKSYLDKLSNDMFNLRSTDKRAYYSIYIKPLQEFNYPIPSIKKDIDDNSLKNIIRIIAQNFIQMKVSNLKVKLQEDIDNFDRMYKDKYEMLKQLSRENIDKINHQIDDYNMGVSSKNSNTQYIYTFIFFILGLFLEVLVFANGWENIDKNNLENQNNEYENSYHELVMQTSSLERFYNFKENDNYKSLDITFYIMVEWLVRQKKDVKLHSNYSFVTTDMLKIVNPKSNKPYVIRKNKPIVRKFFIKFDVNYQTLLETDISVIYANLKSYTKSLNS
jgi:hypothetical protein